MKRILFKHASIIDGTGAPAVSGDLLVENQTICQIAPQIDCADAQIINCAHKVLCPGFVDVHRHIDYAVLDPNYGQTELRQGITTVLAGHCGFSAAPTASYSQAVLDRNIPILGNTANCEFPSFASYLTALATIPPALHIGAMLGAGTLRIAAAGPQDAGGALTSKQLDHMLAILCEGLESGAFGISFGLLYAPESYATRHEMEQIAYTVQRYDRVLTTHVRGEGRNLVASIREVLDIAQRTGVSLHISHLKAAGKNVWGESLSQAMNLIAKARLDGMDVTCDAYPYTAGSTTLLTLLPPEWQILPNEERRRRLNNPTARKELIAALSSEQESWDNILYSVGWGAVVLSGISTSTLAGLSIADAAAQSGEDPFEFALDLIAQEPNATIVYHTMSDIDMDKVINWEITSIISDAILGGGFPHPRAYGAFPRIISEYVNKKKNLTLEGAIHKMSALPAQQLKIPDTGTLKKGARADLVIFDPVAIRDRANYLNPTLLPDGIERVLVAGKDAFFNHAGQVLRPR